jgi:hypothetical protein
MGMRGGWVQVKLTSPSSQLWACAEGLKSGQSERSERSVSEEVNRLNGLNGLKGKLIGLL